METSVITTTINRPPGSSLCIIRSNGVCIGMIDLMITPLSERDRNVLMAGEALVVDLVVK